MVFTVSLTIFRSHIREACKADLCTTNLFNINRSIVSERTIVALLKAAVWTCKVKSYCSWSLLVSFLDAIYAYMVFVPLFHYRITSFGIDRHNFIASSLHVRDQNTLCLGGKSFTRVCPNSSSMSRITSFEI